MSIARRAASLCTVLVLALGGAALADEPPKDGEVAPAATPAPSATPETAAPAEPIPSVPAAPPIMPATVVTPSGVQGEPAPAAPAPAGATAKPSAATAVARLTTAPPTTTPAQPQSVSLGRYGGIELGRPPQAASRWHGFPISLSLRDAPLPEVLRSFARIAGVNLVLSPGVTGNVTVELKDVPWDQALWVILKTHDMAAEIDGNVWTVEPY